MNKKTSILRSLPYLAISFLSLLAFSCDQILSSMSIALSASQGDYEDQIFLSWNTPIYPDYDEDGEPDATVWDYDIYRDSFLIESSYNGTSYPDTTASPDVEHSYYVRANFDNLDTIASSTVTGYSIRKKNAHMYSSLSRAAADPVVTTDWSQSTWHQVYLQKNWTYHFIAASYGSAPTFNQFDIHKQNDITNELFNLPAPQANNCEVVYTCPSSGYYWIRVQADDAFRFYAWYE